jgi:glycerol-3-phosphate dehydrogenase
MYQQRLPAQVRVLVLGGGIHGVGVLHDLASRGWHDIHLIEKARLAHGTSSKSTKLVHGGLRYLQHIHDFSLVHEALRERGLLLTLAEDLVHPLEILFPLNRKSVLNRWKIRAGLRLYDLLAGAHKIAPHQVVSSSYLTGKAAILDQSRLHGAYSFWDAQTDDLALVRRVAASAARLGAGISEASCALGLRPLGEGWQVDVRTPQGDVTQISARYVVNCLGPWSNQLLYDSGMVPHYQGIANKGIHLILPDLGLKAGLILQTPHDGRICFLLPWLGSTLLGTTEDAYSGDKEQIPVLTQEAQYLLRTCNAYLHRPLRVQDIQGSFAGLRWLPAVKTKNLSTISREHVIAEHPAARGILFTLYGGKLTTYRSLAQIIGDKIAHHAGQFSPSTTHAKSQWVNKSAEEQEIPSIHSRFLTSSL